MQVQTVFGLNKVLATLRASLISLFLVYKETLRYPHCSGSQLRDLFLR